MSVPYTVHPGETLYGISKKFYLTGDYELVARTNGWNPKAGLKAGTTVELANPLILGYYTVKQGDTLYAIANLYFNRNHYMDALMAYNRITDPNTGLKAGTAIRIPLPSGEAKHTVLKGETLFSLSARYFKAQDYQTAVAEANGIAAVTGAIKAGQTLRIPNPFYTGDAVIVSGAAIAGIGIAIADGTSAGTAGSGMTAGSTGASGATAGSTAAGGGMTAGSTTASGAAAGSSATGSTTASSAAAAKPAAAPIKVRSIEIDIAHNKLYVRAGGTVEKSFDIASGKRAGLTPTGSFEIMTKIKNPWYSAKGIPGGDPKNPLGSRWLGLSVPNTEGMTYGIHGTNAPASIGTNASAGCIRMNNKDVEWLYDTVPTGTKVTIHA